LFKNKKASRVGESFLERFMIFMNLAFHT